MKLKATKTEIKNEYYYIISIDYCSAQCLLGGVNPFAYSTGLYGWSCDYYEVSTNGHNKICISTGYGPLNCQNSTVDYKKLQKAEAKASKISRTRDLTWEQQKKKINNVLLKYIDSVIN